jgi:hypothetical protein
MKVYLLLLVGYLDLVFSSYLRLQPSILDSEFIILGILIFDHVAQLLLFLVVLKEMVFEFSCLVIGLTILLLPIIDLSFKVVVAFLHLGNYLLVLVDLNFIVFVVINLAVKF